MTVQGQAARGAQRSAARAEEMERRLRVPLIIATLLVIPVMILQASDVPDIWTLVGYIGDWIIWLTFLAEVILMLRVVPDRRRWMREHPLDVAIVVLTPPVLPAVLQSVRILRLLRLVRVFRLAPLLRSVFSIRGVEYAAFLAFLTLVAGGQAFASLEKTSLQNGMYWAISTMTTVGYGDFKPDTAEGKLLAAVVMLVGIGFVAVVTGAIAQRFVVTEDTVTEGNRETMELQEAVLARLDSLHARLDGLERRFSDRESG